MCLKYSTKGTKSSTSLTRPLYGLLYRFLQLAAISNDNLLRGLSALGTNSLNSLDDVHAFNDLSENNVLSVQPRARDSANEELRSICVGPSVSHGQNTRTCVLVDEVLIGKLGTVDRFSTNTASVGEVTSLKHELGNNSVEDGTLEMQRLSRLSHPLLSSAKGSEVLGSLGDCISVELHNDSASWLVVHGDIEENLWVWHALNRFYTMTKGRKSYRLEILSFRIDEMVTESKVKFDIPDRVNDAGGERLQLNDTRAGGVGFRIDNFRNRLTLERDMLQASVRHGAFSVCFLLVISWLAYAHDPRAVLEERKAISGILETSGAKLSRSFESYRDWSYQIMLNFFSETSNRTGYASLRLTKVTFSPCSDGMEQLFTSGSARPNETEYCLSSTDLSVLDTSCSTNETCGALCISPVTEPVLFDCMIDGETSKTTWTGDSLIIKDPFKIKWSTLLHSIQIIFIVKFGENLISRIDSYFTNSFDSINLNVFRLNPDLALPFMIVCITLSGLHLIVDTTYWVKDMIATRNKFPNWRRLLDILTSIALNIIIALRWIYAWLFAKDSEDLENLATYKTVFDCVTFMFILISAGRVIQLLSAHPQTGMVFSIISLTWSQIVKLLCLLIIVFIFFTYVWWLRSGEGLMEIVQELVQIPFGVWPFQNNDSGEKIAFLILYGILTYHFLVVVFQVIINAGFKQIENNVVSQNLFADMWFLVEYGRNPYRDVIIKALDELKTAGEKQVTAEQVAQLTNISREIFDKMWELYWNRFEHILKPSDENELRVDKIKVEETRIDWSNYPSIDEINKQINHLREFLPD